MRTSWLAPVIRHGYDTRPSCDKNGLLMSGLPPTARRRLLVLAAFAVALVMIFYRIGGLPLMQPDEGRNAEVAREMHNAGAWLVPTYDGLAYLDKPAFYFRAVALSFDLFGQSQASARLPSAVAAMVLLGVLFLFLRRLYDARTAALTVLIVATTPLFFAFARLVIFDMPLALFVSLAIFTGYRAEEPGREPRLWYALSWTAMGFATLIKGPIGVVLPLLVLAVLNLAEKQRARWKRLFHPLNIMVFAFLVLPWFIGVTLQHPDFPYYGLVRESLDRLATRDFGRTRPFYFYLPVILGTFFPWSLLLPEGIVLTWRKREQWRRPDRLLVIWAVAVVAFFSLPHSKLPGYILTGVVALGVLAARGFAHAFARRDGAAARVILRATLALGVITLAGGALIAWDATHPGLAAMFDARGRYVMALSPALPLLAACLLVTALVALAACWRRRIGLAFVAFLAFPVMVTTIGFPLFQDYAASHSTRALAERLAPLPPNVRIVCFECFPDGVPFYIQRPIMVVTKDGSELTSNYIRFALNRSRHWPKVLVPLDSFAHWLATRRYPIYLLAKGNQNQVLRRVAAAYGGVVKRLPLGYGAVFLSQPTKG